MADDFANAPLALGIAMRFLFRRYPAQQNVQRVSLGPQHRKNVLLIHLSDVALIVRSVFRFEWWSSHHVLVLAIEKFVDFFAFFLGALARNPFLARLRSGQQPDR